MDVVKQQLDISHDEDDEHLQLLVLAARDYCESIWDRALVDTFLDWKLPCFPSQLKTPPFVQWTTISYRDGEDIARYIHNTYTFDADTLAGAVDLAADTITLPAHGLLADQQLTYSNGGGTNIDPLVDGDIYLTVLVDDDTIQLSLTQGGAAIDLTAGPVAAENHTLALDAADSIYTVSDDFTPAVVSPVGLWPTIADRPDAVTLQWQAGYSDSSSVPAQWRQCLLLLIRHWYDNPSTIGTMNGMPYGLRSLMMSGSYGHYAGYVV